MLTIMLLLSFVNVATQHEHPVMGFDLAKAAHHFFLAETGGRIEVTARSGSDRPTIAQIRAHLQRIAREFGEGRFDAPFATHGEVPPGVPAMRARTRAMTFRYEEMPAGGRVVIATSDGEALAAVHDFLTYQIREHKTGDAITVNRRER